MVKTSQKQAGYVIGEPAYFCGSCRFFISSGACQIVVGYISYNGCCNLWRHNMKYKYCGSREQIKRLLKC